MDGANQGECCLCMDDEDFLQVNELITLATPVFSLALSQVHPYRLLKLGCGHMMC